VTKGTADTVDTVAESRLLRDVDVPATSGDRLGEVARAADRWADEVSRLGGRNTLLRFQELKVGTIDLVAADPTARKRLLDGEETHLTSLFPHEPLRTTAVRSARVLHAKIRELAEERGVWAGYLAVGIATWAEPYAARRPAVPVLLRRLTIEPISPVESDFVLSVSLEPQVNPVLLLAMATRVGIRLEPDDLRDPHGELRYPYVVDRLREHAPAHVVDGFAIAHRAVLGTFTDAILKTAAALRSEASRLGDRPLPAILAGASVTLPPPGPAAKQRLALDADDAQAEAIDALVTSGSHVVLAGPGTGLTQTLANTVTALVADGQRVLVVAEPRAPLRDLHAALDHIGLGDAVLDLAADVTDGDALTAIRDALINVSHTALPEVPEVVADEAATTLQAYATWLRTAVAPWWISPYEARAALQHAPQVALADVEIAPEAIAALHGTALARVREALGELADANGLRAFDATSGWGGAVLDTSDDAAAAVEAARRLRREGLSAAHDAATRAAVEIGYPVPNTMGEARSLAELLEQVRDTLRTFLPEIWQAPLEELVGALGDHAWRAEHGSPGWFTRRRLRHLADDLRLNPHRGPTGSELHRALLAARDRLARWRSATYSATDNAAENDGFPQLSEHSARAIAAIRAVDVDLAVLEAALPEANLAQLPYAELGQRLADLVTDQGAAHRLPRLRALHRQLSAAGLDQLMTELRSRGADRSTALASFDRLWHSGVLEALRKSDPLRDVADPDALVNRFREADVQSLAAFAGEARRRYATAVRAVAAADTAGAASLSNAGELTAALHSARDLVLTVKPVWVVPTLRVAQAIPGDVLFDVTIVEAAHLVPPAAAVPALARGRRAIVAGNPVGVAPSAFTVSAEPEFDGEADSLPNGRQRLPSLLDQLKPVLPQHVLRTHYRSADERLVRLAAAHLPGSELSAWPGARGDASLRLDLVTQPPLADGQEESVAAEVAHVVELVLRHARTRPHDSLAVVTLGPRHAERIRDAIRVALMSATELEPFFRPDKTEPFVIWTVEHARADVRDAVILSVGYGRTAEGRLLYRFGSLGDEGGDRRLVTATTRARQQMVVVSSFRGDDMNPRRLLSAGPRLLREFLIVAAHGAPQAAPDAADAGHGLEGDIARRLLAAGLPVLSDVGYGALRLPAVIREAGRPGRPLAVVTDRDGQPASARFRERILPQHLERLGWSVVRVWSSRWAADPDREVARIQAAWHAARNAERLRAPQ
jgi:REase_MTES_1575